jgi:DNA-binding response OmpR family regulator
MISIAEQTRTPSPDDPAMMTDAGDDAPSTVLVVEDEALVAMLVADTLAAAGYRPAWSPDGRTGPASAERVRDATAAVVDLRLSDGRDGRQVVRRLRERHPALPVVVVTGFHREAPQADLRGVGGPTLRLHKPVDCDDLVSGLSLVLDAPAESAEAKAPRRRASDVLEEAA